ncbi:hypothetical protein MHYP_G00283410 [Metynnis hypsauchen]
MWRRPLNRSTSTQAQDSALRSTRDLLLTQMLQTNRVKEKHQQVFVVEMLGLLAVYSGPPPHRTPSAEPNKRLNDDTRPERPRPADPLNGRRTVGGGWLAEEHAKRSGWTVLPAAEEAVAG